MGTRNLVRSHVMRDFQHKKHLKETSKARRNRAISMTFEIGNLEQGFGNLVEEIRKDDWEEEDAQQSMEVELSLPSPQLLLGGTEPFNVVPIAGTPRLQLLMHYYNTVLLNTLIPVNPKDKWFSYAITDPALFHVTMLHAVMHHALVHGEEGGEEEALALKSEAISLVNRKLEDPVEGISDVTIAVVANLVQFENQSGNIELSSVHMRGLQRMIALRGGLNVLGLAGVLRRKILWGDLLNATLAGTEPQFSLSSAATTSDPYASLGDSIEMSGHPPECTCSSQFSSLLHGLQLMSNTKSINTNLEGCFSDQIYLMERQLLYLFKGVQEFFHLHSPNCRATVVPCIIAAQVYLYMMLRDFPSDVPIFTTFIGRLESTFILEDVVEIWEGKHELLIWVLTLTSLVARGDRKLEYVENLADVCQIVGIESLQDLTDTLEVVAWRDARQDLSLVSLWNEVHCTMVLDGSDFQSEEGA
ncbi:uncharacterized protein PAC_05941 [Phialocephala subalpina]|uniref:Transcription factor domain-containing protein n=1 Tax=Phialocephala subalpina TaxID=576137 RepID=A0A1L7WTI8_9HELO|nr:uncharacterized protein PAC_05941 [Phialocephala subalpina]